MLRSKLTAGGHSPLRLSGVLSLGPQATHFLVRLLFKMTPSCFYQFHDLMADGDGGPCGAGAARRGDTSGPPSWESLYLTVVLTPSPPSPARFHLPGLDSTSTTPGGLGGGGLPQAVQGAPSPAGQCQGLPSPQCGMESLWAFLCKHFAALLALLGLLSTAYVKDFAFSNGPRGWCGKETW